MLSRWLGLKEVYGCVRKVHSIVSALVEGDVPTERVGLCQNDTTKKCKEKTGKKQERKKRKMINVFM